MNIDLRVFAIIPVLFYHGRADAFFGIGISNTELYVLIAIAIMAILVGIALLVFGIAKLVKVCRARNSLLPAWMAVTIIMVVGVITSVVKHNAQLRDAEYKKKYYENSQLVVPDEPPKNRVTTTDRVATKVLPKASRPVKPQFPQTIKPVDIRGPRKTDEAKPQRR